MLDRFASFAQLQSTERYGVDYAIRALTRPASPVAVVAPHGGKIENGTSRIALLVAGQEHNLFCFEGLKPRGNRDLHITSHRFDHPDCVALVSRSTIAVTIHGCIGDCAIYVGGLDHPFGRLLIDNLRSQGFPATREGHAYPGVDPMNICNRTQRGCGAQLEITADLRTSRSVGSIVTAVRTAISQHVAGLAGCE